MASPAGCLKKPPKSKHKEMRLRRDSNSQSPQARVRWRNLDTRLNDSYEADKIAVLNKQLDDLRLADERGHYTTT